jgi:tRNA(fMet)-specific endonuclease VapC
VLLLILIKISHSLVGTYVQIDLFSQGKHPQYALPQGITARNMSKNDLWIAATAYTTHSELITTDSDFIYLNDTFFKVHFIPMKRS